MKIEADIPEGYHIMNLETSITAKGALHFRVWIRQNPLGEFAGAASFDLQTAVDMATKELKNKRARLMQDSPMNKLGIQLNLAALGLKED